MSLIIELSFHHIALGMMSYIIHSDSAPLLIMEQQKGLANI